MENVTVIFLSVFMCFVHKDIRVILIIDINRKSEAVSNWTATQLTVKTTSNSKLTRIVLSKVEIILKYTAYTLFTLLSSF